MTKEFYAHSGLRDDKSDWQSLAEHLRSVGAGACERARAALPNLKELHSAATLAGLLHDLGKYRLEFQQYICGFLKPGNPLTYHKQAEAAKAVALKQNQIAFAIHEHHGGMPDKTDLESGIRLPVADCTIPFGIVQWAIAPSSLHWPRLSRCSTNSRPTW